ncbi:MAG: PEP-CTERM sorting domain-containing protein [Candidatus Hydrogenedentes bacterium]|nr:PEP-CTERM sorting domain-containing protein [Candidatus Hydrogenedentota bacterium]
MCTHHRFLGLAVCWALLVALVPGAASATCVTLTFEGDVTCYEDNSGDWSIYNTYADSTITVVLEIPDLSVFQCSQPSGLQQTRLDGEGTVVSATWADAGGTVLSDYMNTLDQTFAGIQAEYTYRDYSYAWLDLDVYQNPATDEFSSVYLLLRGDMGGLEEIEPAMPLYGLNYFEIDACGSNEGEMEAAWRFGEWILPAPVMVELWQQYHDFETFPELYGSQMRYEFEGALVGYSVEGLETGVVPEPASVTLLGLGLAAIAALRARKRQ